MGGKRPDQHNIDPREARASDHKYLFDDEHLVEEAKADLGSVPHNEQQMIPPAGTNPALRELRGKKGAPLDAHIEPQADGEG